MNPFVIWLNKQELDELLSTIIKSDVEIEKKQEILSHDEFVNYSQNLLKQNNRLIQLFKKIEPLNEIQKSKVHVSGIKAKCKLHQENLSNLKSHCSVYSKPIPGFNNGETSCKDCIISKMGLV